MAEDSDPAVSDGQPSESPADETSFGMITDEVPQDNSQSEPESPEGHTEDDAKSSETNVAPDERERGYMRQQDYSRKTADLAREREALQAERETFRKELQEQFQKQFEELRSQAVPQQQQHDGQLTQLLNDPNLSPQDRAGVQTLMEIRQAQAELAQQIQDFQQFREQLEPQFQEYSQTVQGLTKAQQEAQAKELRAQGQEAVEMFGEDAVRESVDFIQRNHGAVNPRTQKPYTVAELVGLATGRTAEQAQQAREGNQGRRRAAQKTAAANGSTPSSVGTKGAYSRSDAIAEIAANMG